MAKPSPTLSAKQLAAILGSLLLVEPIRWLIGKRLDAFATSKDAPVWAAGMSSFIANAQPYVIGAAAFGALLLIWGNWQLLSDGLGRIFHAIFRPWRQSAGHTLVATGTVQGPPPVEPSIVQRAASATPQQVHPQTVRSPPRLRLSVEESERRVKILDELFRIIKQEAEPAGDNASRLCGMYREIIIADGPEAFAARVDAIWRDEINAVGRKIGDLYQRNELLEAAFPKEVLSGGGSAFPGAVAQLKESLKCLYGIPAEYRKQTVPLLAPAIAEFKVAAEKYGQWITASRPAIAEARRQAVNAIND